MWIKTVNIPMLRMSCLYVPEGQLIALSNWAKSELQFSGKVFSVCSTRINISEALHFSHRVCLFNIITINTSTAKHH